MTRIIRIGLFAAGACLSAPVAFAQVPQTRADLLTQARREKSEALRPNEPDALLRGMTFVEQRAVFLLTREGLHPKLGSLTTGSGFAFGVGYRERDLLNHRGVLELWTAASMKRYWAIEGRAVWPELADRRLMLEVVGGLREYPQEDFFGLGPDSLRTNHADFRLRTARVAANAGVRPWSKMTIGGGVQYLRPRVGDGTNVNLPSIGERFSASEAPGWGGANAKFLVTRGFLDVDYREPLNARRGGWYRIDVNRYRDTAATDMRFTRTDIDLRQFIGFFKDRRVLALRGWVSTMDSSPAGGVIPFYLMPHLGGNETLRGFRNYRFRGPHALLLQAEYRWEIWSALEGALFYDAGKVETRRSRLGLNNLESDYGFGFRFNTANGVVMRVDAAFGSREGKHLHIVFGGVF